MKFTLRTNGNAKAGDHPHLIRHVVNHDDAVGSSVVTGRDGAEPFLTGRVPLRRQSTARQSGGGGMFIATYLCSAHNLKLYGLSVQLDGPDLEVHPDGADVALCVRVILAENTHRGGSGWRSHLQDYQASRRRQGEGL